jgi:hypothetical protein
LLLGHLARRALLALGNMGKAASAAENAAIPIPPAGTFSLFCPAVIDENLFELPNYKANSNSTHNYEDNRVFHDLSSFCRAYDGRLSGALCRGGFTLRRTLTPASWEG